MSWDNAGSGMSYADCLSFPLLVHSLLGRMQQLICYKVATGMRAMLVRNTPQKMMLKSELIHLSKTMEQQMESRMKPRKTMAVASQFTSSLNPDGTADPPKAAVIWTI